MSNPTLPPPGPGTWDAVVLRLDGLLARVGRLTRALRHVNYDLSPENDQKRMKPCKCGRQWSRLDFCAVCEGEQGGAK